MDSSTTDQCVQLEEYLGGPETLTALTGIAKKQINLFFFLNKYFCEKIYVRFLTLELI